VIPGPVLLVSCYELGRQPLALAWARASLERAGHPCRSLDLAVEPFRAELLEGVSLVAISVPMHTALRLGVGVGERLRSRRPDLHLAFFGLYAWLNAEHLLATTADSVLAGESEGALVELAGALARGSEPRERPGLRTRRGSASPALERLDLPVPVRTGLPPLSSYAGFESSGERVLAGHVEASRGCLHHCRHCPIVPVYGGRFFAVPLEVVLADARQQIEEGARHLSFGDPDFLNGPTHALRVARALHREHPDVGFDFTAKVEHLLRHRGLLPELVESGARFAVSAVESLSDTVLARLRKGHTAADLDELLDVADAAGLELHPTFVAFTPWTSLDDYLAQLDWVERHDLADRVPPIQHTIRLLVPPGSALLRDPETAAALGPLDATALGHPWRHPDPRMDALQREAEARVAGGAVADEAPQVSFEAVRALAWRAAGREASPPPARTRRRGPAPRLTEHWFC
jgi:radical SAM superfamily enzyme YgiQ (UPF0313 family)